MASRDKTVNYTAAKQAAAEKQHHNEETSTSAKLDPNAPEWMKITQFIKHNIQDAKHIFTQLQQAQKQHLTFSMAKNQTKEEEQINKLTKQFQLYLDNSKKKFKQLQALLESNTNNKKTTSAADLQMQKHARDAVAQDLYELVKQFRDNQKDFFKKLSEFKKRVNSLNPMKKSILNNDLNDNDDDDDLLNDLSPEEQQRLKQKQEQLYKDPTILSDSQMQHILAVEREAIERDRELRSLLENIAELNQLFIEFSELVTYQQQILDRIDDNINVATATVQKGNEDLRTANQYQAKPWNIFSWLWK